MNTVKEIVDTFNDLGMHRFAVLAYKLLERVMARTSTDAAPEGDTHDHDYQEIRNRHVTSTDGLAPHLHVVPPWPATRTEMSNGHDHELPTRIKPE